MDGIDIDRNEALHITISVIAISFAFALVFSGTSGILQYPREFLFFFAAVFVTVGSGFILHEMAHKLSGIYYGAPARFVMSVQGLVLTVMTGFFGFLIALPGATYIYSNTISLMENAVISAAGPVLNIALVFLFLALNAVAPISQYYSFLYPSPAGFEGFGIFNGTLMVWQFGAAMNLWLALFNFIPAFPLDGSKVWRWRKSAWLILAAFMLYLGAVIISPSILLTWIIVAAIMTVISKLIFG